MTAKELRIGNWVTVGCGINSIVTTIATDGAIEDLIQLEGNAVFNRISQIQPIPLTKEWLVKFGFVNGEKDNFSFTKYMDLRILGSEADYNGIWFGKVFYVHQLQNLYFALCGVELTQQQ